MYISSKLEIFGFGLVKIEMANICVYMPYLPEKWAHNVLCELDLMKIELL